MWYDMGQAEHRFMVCFDSSVRRLLISLLLVWTLCTPILYHFSGIPSRKNLVIPVLARFDTSIPPVVGSFVIKPTPRPTTQSFPEELGYEGHEVAELLLSATEEAQKQEEVNVYGAHLDKILDFWLIFTIMPLSKSCT